MPLMKSLDISYNPIRVLTKESFYGLVRLQLLRVQHLPDLKRFDGDSLAHISYLTKLYIQSWPSIEKYKFRLGSVVSGIASLRTLSAIINEPNGLLTDQILGKARFRNYSYMVFQVSIIFSKWLKFWFSIPGLENILYFMWGKIQKLFLHGVPSQQYFSQW